MNFVDLKSIIRMDLYDLKLGFYKEVKELEIKIVDLNLVLNSFILLIIKLKDWVNMELIVEEFVEWYILFMENNYL